MVFFKGRDTDEGDSHTHPVAFTPTDIHEDVGVCAAPPQSKSAWCLTTGELDDLVRWSMYGVGL